MATHASEMSAGVLAVLPVVRRPRRSSLDAAGALDLAVLGATARRTVALDRLLNTVWCLSGGEWCPPREVVFDALQRATTSGTVDARESWVKSVPFVFNELMRVPLPGHDDPVARAGASIKYGLLDLVRDEDVVGVAADLKRFYMQCRETIETSRSALATDRAFLHRAVGERLSWIDYRMDSLNEMIADTSRRPPGAARSEAFPP